jgi:hypothetical protein
MAHFAEIDPENLLVRRVLVVPNDQEHRGQEFLANDLGLGGTWIQTSYNNNIRKNFAGAGYTYDEERDAFIAPKPFNKWILNEETCQWEAPILRPGDSNQFWWNENKKEWEELITD